MNKFQIKLFGALDVTDETGKRVVVPGSKQQALLSCLALSPKRPPSRERLIGLLWGERFNDQARQSLRQGISKLRQLLVIEDEPLVWANADRVGLNMDLVSIDLSDFQALTHKDDPISDEKAVSLFQNTLLDGLFVREPAFEELLESERGRINELAFPVFERFAAHQLKTGEQARSLETAKRLLLLDPLRESSHRLLMRILAQSGQRAAAIQQYNACAEVLLRELEVEPDPETIQVLEEIKSASPLPELPDEIINRDASTVTQRIQVNGSPKVTIATVPFLSSGAHPDLPAFVGGLTEDLIAALTRFRWLDVIAHLVPADAAASGATLHQRATDQNVLYFVEGSARQLGDTLRITAQLVELQTGKYVWVHRYDRGIDELAVLPDELSETIAAAVESELVSFEGEKARSVSNDMMGAWDCYHLGLSTQYEFSVQGNARAQALFRRAIELDPSFASAYARLSYALVLSAIYFEADHSSGLLDEALELARTATRLDDQDAIARFALGRTHLARKEYDRSILELEQAIEMNPGLAQAHCGLGDSLAYLGQSEDAIPKFEEAIRLSPHDPHRWAFLMYGAIAHIFAGDFERASEWALSAVRVPNSHFWANAALVSAFGHLGRGEDAAAARAELMQLKPEFTCEYARQRLFYLSQQEQVDQYIEGLIKAGVAEG